MKFELCRTMIKIVPECEADEVYLAHVLGIERKGDSASAEFVSVIGIETSMAYVAVKKSPRGEQ